MKLEFLAVADIHDLFEIFSSIATVVAVFFGIGAWRHQVSGQADLELARRVAIEATRVKETAVEAWVDAKFSINQCPFGFSSLPPHLLEQMAQAMDARVKRRELLKIDLLAVLQEARAIWGRDFSDKYNDLIELFSICNRCANSFVSWADSSGHINSKGKHAQNIKNIADCLDELGLLNVEGHVEKEIVRITAAADLALEKKMLRGN